MNLHLTRINSSPDDTIGLLSVDGKFVCFTLEDEHRDIKVPGETRIPSGRYQITLKDFGGFHDRYTSKFPGMHKGMLWLRDVPGFSDILIHIGNDESNTAGCLLVGDSCTQNVDRKGFIGQSSLAYKRIYPPIAAALETGEQVFITVEDEQ